MVVRTGSDWPIQPVELSTALLSSHGSSEPPSGKKTDQNQRKLVKSLNHMNQIFKKCVFLKKARKYLSKSEVLFVKGMGEIRIITTGIKEM